MPKKVARRKTALPAASTNGGTPLPARALTRKGRIRLLTLSHMDQRTAAYASVVNLIDALSNDLGGAENLSAAQHQLVQRSALIGAVIADYETRWTAGQDVQLSEYFTAVGVQRRLLATLGLERKARDVSPSLADIVREREREEAAP